jgi:hypothetical protein
MRYIGAVFKKQQALKDGLKAAKECKCTFVWEKAKCGEKGKRKVCYRGYLELRRKKPEVMSHVEWKKIQRYL